MKRLLSIGLMMFCCCYMMGQQTPDTATVVGKLQYVYALKNVIDDRVWPGFADKENDVTLIYYDDTCCYVVNPSVKILARYKTKALFRNEDVGIFRMQRIDSVPFHMHVTFTDEEDRIDFREPIMRCSSLELTSKTIPDVTTVREWVTMVMHEYFHGFQFKQDGFLDAYEKSFATCPQDTLSTLQAQHEWYRESILQENELLLKAIGEANPDKAKAHIREFFELRDNRRYRMRKEQKTDIAAAEQFMEIMEGSARYIEYQLYEYFGNFCLSDAKWLYTAGKNYYYATGFNLLRLLDKLGIEYRSYIFKDVSDVEKTLRGL